MSRIVVVHWAFPPTVGGVETHLWEYTQRLSTAGHKVLVVTGTEHALSPKEGVEVRYDQGLDLSGPLDRSGLEGRMRGLLSGADVVHGHNLHHFVPEPAEALTKLSDELGFRLVHTFHSFWDDEPRHAAFAEVAGWSAHYAVSDYLCGRLKQCGLSPKRTYLGVDTSRYRDIPWPPPGELTTLLLPARLVPDKGAKEALLAFAEVRKRRKDGSRLRLVLTRAEQQVDFHGEQLGFLDELTQLAKELGVSEQVRFVAAGWADMPGLYASAHIVLCPSKFGEPLGLSALEAQCAGRPVIFTRDGGLGEAVAGGVAVQPGSVSALADAILGLLGDPAAAQALGEKGRSWAVEHFDLDRARLPDLLACYDGPSVEGLLPGIGEVAHGRSSPMSDLDVKAEPGELESVH